MDLPWLLVKIAERDVQNDIANANARIGSADEGIN
jgi:hypothetical protein